MEKIEIGQLYYYIYVKFLCIIILFLNPIRINILRAHLWIYKHIYLLGLPRTNTCEQHSSIFYSLFNKRSKWWNRIDHTIHYLHFLHLYCYFSLSLLHSRLTLVPNCNILYPNITYLPSSAKSVTLISYNRLPVSPLWSDLLWPKYPYHKPALD